jgi:hypothetical protein
MGGIALCQNFFQMISAICHWYRNKGNFSSLGGLTKVYSEYFIGEFLQYFFVEKCIDSQLLSKKRFLYKSNE